MGKYLETLEAQTRLAYRLTGMAMAAYARGLEVEGVQAFGFRDDLYIRGLLSPDVLLEPDASYELKAPVVLQRGVLEIAGLVSLAKYTCTSDPFSLQCENLRNAKALASLLEPNATKSNLLLARLRREAEEIIEPRWRHVEGTVKAILRKGRVDGQELLDYLGHGKPQPLVRQPAAANGQSLKPKNGSRLAVLDLLSRR